MSKHTGGRESFELFPSLLYLLLVLSCIAWNGATWARADDAAAQPAAPAGNNPHYHTPMAGENALVTFLGQTIYIPAFDRARLTSINLGGSVFDPRIGPTGGIPIVALYTRQYFDDSRFRAVVGFAVNELEYDKSVGFFDLVSHFENYTLPGDFTEIQDNHEMKFTALTWGSLMGSFGPGLRIPVAPFEVDNDLRVQLLGQVGYFYAEKSHGSGPDVVVPPNTLLYGAKLRVRYDSLRRNLLELPHKGVAIGFDADYVKRDDWAPVTIGGSTHSEYGQINGYLTAAGSLPGFSEKNRVLLNFNGGKTTNHSGDRFNAFHINGGPFPGEADDMIRPHYTGLLHEDVWATSYATVSAGYRRELAFFLYLSLIGSYIWGDRVAVEGFDRVVFKGKSGAAGTVSIDSAFFWNSELYVAYTWESNFIRNGRPGNGVTIIWNKLF